MRLTLTFHNIQINIHIYHDFFPRSCSLLSLCSYFCSSRTCFSCRSLALEKYIATFSCNLHSFRRDFFFLHSRRMSIKFTPAHSSVLTFIAHEFAMYPPLSIEQRTEKRETQQAEDETNSAFFYIPRA